LLIHYSLRDRILYYFSCW